MAIQLTGLGGFDSGSVISQLVDLANQPLRDIDTKKGQVDSASLTLNSFSTKLAALKTAATALSTTSGFSSMAATSTDPAIALSVTGSAVASSYTVEVTQLAAAQKTRSEPQASATTALGQVGDFTVQIGNTGAPVTISIVATDSLSDIASKIGQSGARVSASIINAGGSYRLSIQGLDTGAANGFTLSESGTVSLGFYADPLNSALSAKDAMLEVDGLPVTRPTNQIADAVPGVTLALTKTTTAGSPATIRVSSDASALKTKITAFVTAYNDVINAGHSATGYGSAKASNAVLSGDSVVRRALDRVSSLVSGLVPGSLSSYRSLATVGVNLTRDGVMTFDGAKLDTALERDPSAVRRLFVTDDTSTGATGVMKTLSDAVNAMITGDGAALKGRIDSLAAQSRRLTESRAQKEKRVTAYEQQLRKQFSNLDQAMSRYTSMSSALTSIK